MTEKIEAVVIGSGYTGVSSRQQSGRCSAQFTRSKRADRGNS
ncbi:hypothetical protein ABZZ20_23755 [Streptomyces sp. NPDC006430]